MIITYLGTAAYEGVPAMYCECEVCRYSLAAGGRNIRSRSQALINDDLLIDFNPDTVTHYHRFGFDPKKIDNCLITHAHSDHFYPEDMLMATQGYAQNNDHLTHFFAGRKAYDRMLEKMQPRYEKTAKVIAPELVEPGKEFTAGRYRVLPVPANHDPNSSPVIYAISDGQKSLLYGHDSGYYSEESWALLKTFGRFDLVSLDCTCMLQVNARKHHMSYDVNLEIRDRMLKEGMADGRTVFVVNHFSHNGAASYDGMVKICEKDGVIVSYDGMKIEI